MTTLYDSIEQGIMETGVKKLSINNPGGVMLSSWYPSEYNTEHHIADAINSSGKIRISSNNLALGATSNFTISSSELVYGIALNCALTTPAASIINAQGWFFSLINTVEFTISNSTMGNQVLTGTSMRELLLAACENREQREMLLFTAGDVTPAATAARATIPLAWMLQQWYVGLGGQYPIDMATISGSIQVNVTFNNSTSIVTRTGGVPEAITAFTELTMTTLSTQILKPVFAVRSAMIRDPSLKYSIPGKFLSYTRYTQSMTPGTASTLQIAAAPLGELQAIILTVKPVAELTATADGTILYPGSCRLSSLRLEYSGQIIYQANSFYEHLHYMRQKFQGDDKTYSYTLGATNSATAANRTQVESQVLIIPLCYDGKEVMTNKKIEYLPGYSGSVLSLTMTIASTTAPDVGARSIYAAATPFFPTPTNPQGGGGAQNYIVECLFLMNSVLVIDSSQVQYYV